MVGRKALKIKTFLADARMRLQIDAEALQKKRAGNTPRTFIRHQLILLGSKFGLSPSSLTKLRG